MMSHLLKPLVRTNLSRSISLTRNNMQQILSNKGSSNKVPESIKRAQKIFQEKNDLPVFLKGGKQDKILFYTTVGLTGMGLIMWAKFVGGYIID